MIKVDILVARFFVQQLHVLLEEEEVVQSCDLAGGYCHFLLLLRSVRKCAGRKGGEVFYSKEEKKIKKNVSNTNYSCTRVTNKR